MNNFQQIKDNTSGKFIYSLRVKFVPKTKYIIISLQGLYSYV